MQTCINTHACKLTNKSLNILIVNQLYNVSISTYFSQARACAFCLVIQSTNYTNYDMMQKNMQFV